MRLAGEINQGIARTDATNAAKIIEYLGFTKTPDYMCRLA